MKNLNKKSIIAFFCSVMLLICFGACKKSTSNSSGTSGNNYYGNTPTAVAAYDHTNAGIYKGVVAGSTGYYVIYIKNNDNKVFALLNFDGIHDSLLCPALNSYTPTSTANITNAIFTSALGTSDSIILNITGNGTTLSVNVIIPGHNTTSTINKETSTSVVKLYQGTVYDTLVAGYFYNPCGSGTKAYPPTLKVSPLNIAVQGNIASIVVGHPYIPTGYYNGSCNNNGSQLVVTSNGSNQLDFIADPDCSHNHAVINITDTVISGTVICPLPYTPGVTTCFDWYNSYIHAVRVN